jgi:hypothetical protein
MTAAADITLVEVSDTVCLVHDTGELIGGVVRRGEWWYPEPASDAAPRCPYRSCDRVSAAVQLAAWADRLARTSEYWPDGR